MVQIEESLVCIMGGKQTCLTFALKGDITFIILDNKPTCSLIWKKTISLIFKVVFCTNILEKIVENKRAICTSAYKMGRGIRIP